MDHDPLRRGFAEFVGTFALIFVGAGSILALTTQFEPAIDSPQTQGVYGGLTLVAIALSHGLVIAVMVSAVGHISGGHFNPAVTLGFVVTRRIEPMLAAVYWATQLVAATFAALLVRWLLPSVGGVNPAKLGAPAIAHVSSFEAAVLELMLTFFLVWVV